MAECREISFSMVCHRFVNVSIDQYAISRFKKIFFKRAMEVLGLISIQFDAR